MHKDNRASITLLCNKLISFNTWPAPKVTKNYVSHFLCHCITDSFLPIDIQPVLFVIYARADVERDMKHEDLALVDLEEAIRLDASSADAYLLRGNIYLVQKKKALAKSDFEKAISLGVPPADLHEQLKQCR